MNAQPGFTANVGTQITSNLSNAMDKLPSQESMQQGISNLGNTLQNTSSQLTDTFSEFSKQSATVPEATTGFLQSNTIIAKFAFIILVLIGMLVLLNLGVILISILFGPSDSPYLINGMIDGNNSMVVHQDPKQGGSATILRSNNEDSGAEFTWSSWLYINDLGNQDEKYQHVFSKGDGQFDAVTNLSSMNNSPGVYLEPKTNNLRVMMDTVKYGDANTSIVVENMPIKKWIHLAIRLQNKIIDIYVNGTLSKRMVLSNVPKQNYSDVYIAQNGGFNGKLSSLRYYNSALNVFDINSIVRKGPNLTVKDGNLNTKYFSYLSNYWYYSKTN
uniref:LamG-like jellyroll fold domain-containing protein n=1 Tax=viral metagenome TaxID=1070528 RepID=A0A6C0IKV1_9ZZZZ